MTVRLEWIPYGNLVTFLPRTYPITGQVTGDHHATILFVRHMDMQFQHPELVSTSSSSMPTSVLSTLNHSIVALVEAHLAANPARQVIVLECPPPPPKVNDNDTSLSTPWPTKNPYLTVLSNLFSIYPAPTPYYDPIAGICHQRRKYIDI